MVDGALLVKLVATGEATKNLNAQPSAHPWVVDGALRVKPVATHMCAQRKSKWIPAFRSGVRIQWIPSRFEILDIVRIPPLEEGARSVGMLLPRDP